MKLLTLTTFLLFTSLAQAKGKACEYQFDVANSVVEGTGFKYTEKTGVTARFTGFKLNKTEKVSSEKALLEGLKVTVDLMTLNSGNGLRDKNMRETLFSNILGDSVAKVSVKKVTDKKIETELVLNEKTQPVIFDYKVDKGLMVATGSFDAAKLAMGEQIAALKKRCGSLHTGSDGKSVTWTTFDLKVTAKINKTCSK